MSSSASMGHTNLQACHQSLRFPEHLEKPILDQKMAVQVGKYLTEMRMEPPPAAALSSNTALFFMGLHASKSPCPQLPIARIRAPLHIISVSFPVAGGFQAPWNSRTPRVYTQDGDGMCPGAGQRTVGLTTLSCLSLASSSPQITPSACHSKMSPCSFYLHFWTSSSFPHCMDNAICFPSFSLPFFQPEFTRWIHLFLFQKLSVTNISAKGLIQAARDWWEARYFDHSLSLSAMSLYELTLKLFKVLTAPLCELTFKKE